MSRGSRNRTKIEMGHDSFLDIVANLVGILIILVVILGTQSHSVIQQVREEAEKTAPVIELGPPPASVEQVAEISRQTARARSAQSDSDRFEAQIKTMDQKVEELNRQRGLLLDLLAQAKLAWEDAKKEIDQEKADAAARQTKIERLQSELADLEGERARLESMKAPIVAVEHLPTPMAKTVFGDEIHFRLRENRLSVVPIEKLISEIKQDFKRVASGPREGMMDAAVGPVKGYVARYVMNKRKEYMRSSSGAGPGMRIQLVKMTVEPLSEPYGEPIQDILANSQTLDIELAGRKPGSTTITVWVYPDSFAAFRQLKETLYAKGYPTAARPLPMDRAITGGPQGSRSAAQ